MGCLAGGGGVGGVVVRETEAGPIAEVPGHIMGWRRERGGAWPVFFSPLRGGAGVGAIFPSAAAAAAVAAATRGAG